MLNEALDGLCRCSLSDSHLLLGYKTLPGLKGGSPTAEPVAGLPSRGGTDDNTRNVRHRDRCHAEEAEGHGLSLPVGTFSFLRACVYITPAHMLNLSSLKITGEFLFLFQTRHSRFGEDGRRNHKSNLSGFRLGLISHGLYLIRVCQLLDSGNKWADCGHCHGCSQIFWCSLQEQDSLPCPVKLRVATRFALANLMCMEVTGHFR